MYIFISEQKSKLVPSVIKVLEIFKTKDLCYIRTFVDIFYSSLVCGVVELANSKR